MRFDYSAEDSGAEVAEDTEVGVVGRTEVGAEVLGPSENGTRAMEIR